MTDIISWEKAIGKKVKSSDERDLGKIQAITKDYIQTKDGTVSKDYYYIPKYYITGYDGDHIWVSITKGEAKSRFEKEKVPNIAEWETPSYVERRALVAKEYPDFATNIPTYTPAAPAITTTPATSSPEGVPVSWDKIIDKKVKSSDDRDLGEVKAIAPKYIEGKEGTVSKKHYFIPKNFVQGFDGHKLFVGLTKDEVKDRYERESPPSLAEMQSPNFYGVSSVEQIPTIHGVPMMAKEPDTAIPVDYSGTSYNVPWDQLIHKHVRTTDNVEVGYVERIGNEFIVVREGVADVHIYYIPKTYIKEYDGSQLWIDVPSGLVRAKFEMDREPAVEELRSLARQAPRYKRRAMDPSVSDVMMANEMQAQRTSEDASTVVVQNEVDLDKVGEPASSREMP